MRSKLALATMLAVALIAPAALPCGAPFGTGISADPQQDIVVAYENDVETYVFQPRFCGNAKEFGLILPVPAMLTGQPTLSKAEVFSYLDTLSTPTYQAVTKCSNRNRGGDAGYSGAAGGTGTGVVSSGTVGFMDYTQLETSSSSALTDWLSANGYPFNTLAEAAFQYYVDKGWYFVAFKVSQGTFTGSTTCKDLGPVKLSFPTATPVVPTRMATARARDTTGALPYSTGFSWRVYGITQGAQQVGFASQTTNTQRAANYSGLLLADDVSHLDSLGAAGDRMVKLTLTFNYGSTDPDIGLALIDGKDYREIKYVDNWIECVDGGVDSGTVEDVAPEAVVPPEGPGKADAGAVVAADAAGPPVDKPAAENNGGWCSVSTGGRGELAPLLVAGLILGLVLRRRRR